MGDAADNNIGDGKCDTSSASGKQCTLRAAIQEANANVDADTINFNITSASKVITPSTPLPPITEKVAHRRLHPEWSLGEHAGDREQRGAEESCSMGSMPPCRWPGPRPRGSTVKGLVIQRFPFASAWLGRSVQPPSSCVATTSARTRLVRSTGERSPACVIDRHTVVGGRRRPRATSSPVTMWTAFSSLRGRELGQRQRATTSARTRPVTPRLATAMAGPGPSGSFGFGGSKVAQRQRHL